MACDPNSTISTKQLQDLNTNSKVFNEVVTSDQNVTPSAASDGERKVTLAGLENRLDGVIADYSNTFQTKIPTVDYGSGFIVLSPANPDEYPLNQGVKYTDGGSSAIYRFAGDTDDLPYDLSQPFDESKWIDANVVTTLQTFPVSATANQFIFGPFFSNGEQVEIQYVNVYCNGKKQKELDSGTGLGSYTILAGGQIQLAGWTADEGDIFEFEVNAVRNAPVVSKTVNDILDYTTGGIGLDLTPALQQAIIDSYNKVKPSTIVVPSSFYGELRTKSNSSSAIAMYPGVKILMLPNSCIRNFVAAHMFRTEQSFPAGSQGWIIEGDRSSIIDHNSQAIDDLAADQIALVDQGDQDLGPSNPGLTPNLVKKYSGYGSELYNEVFPVLPQYDGWPFGSPQVAIAYHCVWPENTKGSVLKGFTVRRSHRTSVRGSNTEDIEIIDIYCDEPRGIGINISDNCENPRVVNPTVYSCLQIGIAIFDVDSGTRRGGVYGARCINDPDRPLGENGIEIIGNYPSQNTEFEIVGFQVHGYGSHGLRALNVSSVIISNGVVTNVGLTTVQQIRYPGVTDGTGIGLRETGSQTSTENTIADCVVKNCSNYELILENIDNTISNLQLCQTLSSGDDGRMRIMGVDYINTGVVNLVANGSIDTPAWGFTGDPKLGFYRSASDTAAMTSAVGVCARWGKGDMIIGNTTSLSDTSKTGFLHIPRKVGSLFPAPDSSYGASVPLVFDDINKRLLVLSSDGKWYSFNNDLNFNPDV